MFRSIDYDYQKNFGRPDGSHAVRSMAFDQHLRDFLAYFPNAAIINLGEGLETQRYRIDAPEALWFSIDLPEQGLFVCFSLQDLVNFIQSPPKRAIDLWGR